MPFSRDTLSALIERISNDIFEGTDTGDAVLRERVERVLAEVMAGVAHGLYGYINYVSQQGPPTAESDFESILGWSTIFLKEPHLTATLATGTANFTGTNGTNIPAATQIVNNDGITYQTNALTTIASGTATAAITATTPGSAGNASASTSFSLVNPIAGITSTGTYSAVNGTDDETRDELFARLTARLGEPFRAGGPGDYEAWALEASTDVKSAWEFGGDPEIGWVTVVIATENLGIPGSTLINTVQAYINARAPILKTGVIVRAPVANTLNLTIQDASISQQSNIQAAILDYLRSNSTPGATQSMTILENQGQAFDADMTITSPTVPQSPGAYGVFNALSITWTGDTA